MLQHLRPQYAKAFQCIGSDCEDTCCHGLDVVIDKTAYDKFKSLPDFQPRFREHLVVLAIQPTESRYARIQLTPSYHCPFLSVERLCGIQQKYGEHYLSETCASYPRVTQRIDGLRETALLLSCPEAARLVLLNPDLAPTDDQHGSLPRYHRFAAMKEQPAGSNRSPHQYLWDIREFTLLLVRDRSYPLWQRLFLLGMFCLRLDEVTAARRLGLIPELLRDYADLITQGKLRSAMDGIPVRSPMQLGLILQVIDQHLEKIDVSQVRFRECVRDFLSGIRYDAASPMESFSRFYEDANTRYYRPFMRKHPHILENYLVNYVFRTRFPYGVDSEGKPNDPLTEYLMLCIFYSVMNGLMIGMAGHYKANFDSGHAVKLIQSFTKAVEQAPKFAGATYRGLATADGMALLLKNDA